MTAKSTVTIEQEIAEINAKIVELEGLLAKNTDGVPSSMISQFLDSQILAGKELERLRQIKAALIQRQAEEMGEVEKQAKLQRIKELESEMLELDQKLAEAAEPLKEWAKLVALKLREVDEIGKSGNQKRAELAALKDEVHPKSDGFGVKPREVVPLVGDLYTNAPVLLLERSDLKPGAWYLRRRHFLKFLAEAE